MGPIRLLRTEEIPIETLDELAGKLERGLLVPVQVEPHSLPSVLAWDPVRRQAHSTSILRAIAERVNGRTSMLAVTGQDLFVPVLTFVFGEAQVAGPAAVVSTHRLREEFYGLPPNPVIEAERLLKEALHELGHTWGLRHCDDWRCIMSPAHSVERIDIRSAEYCAQCNHLVRGAAA
jgi:archaemetzincin